MKLIISEQQYHKLLLNELGNRGKGLISYLRQNYEVMGNNFTPRFGGGVKWYTKTDIIDELKDRFNLSPVLATDVVDYFLNRD